MSLWIFFFVMSVVGAIALYSWYYSDEQRVRRALKGSPRAAILQLQTGQVAKITGSVRAAGPLLASPLSGRACVFFETTVEEYRSSGRSGKWVTIIHETEGIDFLVEDETGRALVRGASLKVALARDTDLKSGTFNDADPMLEAFLTKHGHSSKGWVFNKTLRYREGVFEPGERVTVMGKIRIENDPDPRTAGGGYRDVPKRALIEPLDDGHVYASDQNDMVLEERPPSQLWK